MFSQMDKMRRIIIDAIHEATGFLNDTVHFRTVKAGDDIQFELLDLDSLSQFEIIMKIEEELGMDLDVDLVFEHRSVNALASWLHAQRRDGN